MSYTITELRASSDWQKAVNQEYSLGIAGGVFDDRGRISHSVVEKTCKEVLPVEYGIEEKTITFGDQTVYPDEFWELLVPFSEKKVLVNLTSIGFPELLLLLLACERAEVKEIEFLYMEPKDYRTQPLGSGEVGQVYDLTERFDRIESIPGFIQQINRPGTRNMIVSFLGFESSRLRRVLSFEDWDEQTTLRAVVGSPAYRAGWERQTVVANLDGLRHVEQPSSCLRFSPARNPYRATQLLNLIYRALGDRERIFVVPFGTQPMTLGCAIFLAANPNNSKISVLYDFPKPRVDRSTGIGLTHCFRAAR